MPELWGAPVAGMSQGARARTRAPHVSARNAAAQGGYGKSREPARVAPASSGGAWVNRRHNGDGCKGTHEHEALTGMGGDLSQRGRHYAAPFATQGRKGASYEHGKAGIIAGTT